MSRCLCGAVVSYFALPQQKLGALRKLTLSVVTEGHLGLAEANGVFALGDAIELLELGLVDALHLKVRGGSRAGTGCSLDLPGWGSTAQWP